MTTKHTVALSLGVALACAGCFTAGILTQRFDQDRSASTDTEVSAEPPAREEIPVNTAITPTEAASVYADQVVQLYSDLGSCSGSVIKDTPFVVTAAHCVLKGGKRIKELLVISSRGEFTGAEVYVDPSYANPARYRQVLDVAVVRILPVMAKAEKTTFTDPDALVLKDVVVPRDIGSFLGVLPPPTVISQVPIVIAGRQSLFDDGTLYDPWLAAKRAKPARMRDPEDLGPGHNAHRGVAACTMTAAAMTEVADGAASVPCGLVPGASGGPVLELHANGLTLIGVVSTIDRHKHTNTVATLPTLNRVLSAAATGLDEYQGVESFTLRILSISTAKVSRS